MSNIECNYAQGIVRQEKASQVLWWAVYWSLIDDPSIYNSIWHAALGFVPVLWDIGDARDCTIAVIEFTDTVEITISCGSIAVAWVWAGLYKLYKHTDEAAAVLSKLDELESAWMISKNATIPKIWGISSNLIDEVDVIYMQSIRSRHYTYSTLSIVGKRSEMPVFGRLEDSQIFYSSSNYRSRFKEYIWEPDLPSTTNAHHMFPQNFETQFNELGININEPRLMSKWECPDHQCNASAYNDTWEAFFDETPNYTFENVLEKWRDMADEYSLETYF